MSKFHYQFGVFLLALAIFGVGASAQEADKNTRSISSEGFTKNRPAVAGGGTVIKPNAKPSLDGSRPVAYKLIRKDRTSIRWNAAAKPARPRPDAKRTTSDIGVTFWKLRPPLRSDTGVLLPVRINDALTEKWSAVRVSTAADFKAGDRIRFAVESPVEGFLYIINSEMHSDGSYGPPRLIFPDPANQYNAVGPGMLVDIPDQNEPFPYFNLSPQRGNYAGELLAVAVSPVRLNLTVAADKTISGLDEVLDLDAGVDVETFTSVVVGESVYTQAEADSACGSKSRDLLRDKPTERPCGPKRRQLTRDEPPPQTIYRISTQVGSTAVAIIRLKTSG